MGEQQRTRWQRYRERQQRRGRCLVQVRVPARDAGKIKTYAESLRAADDQGRAAPEPPVVASPVPAVSIEEAQAALDAAAVELVGRVARLLDGAPPEVVARLRRNLAILEDIKAVRQE